MTNHLKEKSNYISILLLITDIGTDVYRDVLKTRCPKGSSYTSLISTYKHKIKPYLNVSQERLLFPNIGAFSGNIEELDISVLYVLLRTACSIIPPNTGWGRPPDENDRTISANIERIHLIRNKFVGHNPNAKIEECEFQRELKKIVQSIIELGGQHYHHKISELLNENLERDQLNNIARRVTILEDITSTEYRNQSAIENVEIEKMRTADNFFVNTKVARDAYNLLITEQLLILFGTPGSGKTSLAFHVALRMEKENGYLIHLAKEPTDLKKYASLEGKEIYIFDDVCGKFCLQESIANIWEHYENEINALLTLRKNIKVIIISRSGLDVRSVFKHLDAFKEDNVVNTSLSLTERRSLCEMYLSEDHAKLLDDNTLLKYQFLPLLCKIFSQKEEKQQVVDFFTFPVDIIHEELKMMQEKDPLAFLSLSVLVIFNNSVKHDIFRPANKRLIEVMESICFECQLNCPLRHLIRPKFEMLKEAFIIITETEVCALHDKMFDIMVQFFGKCLISPILLYGESSFLATRLQLQSSGYRRDTSVVSIPEGMEDEYFDAIRRIINDGKLWDVFGNRQSRTWEYRKRFLQYLRTQQDIDWKNLFDTDGATSLFISAFCGYYEYCRYILQQDKSLINKCDHFGRSPLYAASRNGYEQIVILLLRNNADVNIMSQQERAPLHRAHENKDIARLLLLYGADVNQRGWKQRTPLHFACEAGKEELAQCLIHHGAEINSFDEYSWRPLHVATHFGHKRIVELLVHNRAKLNVYTTEGFSPYAIATLKNHTDLIDLLYHDSSAYTGCKASGYEYIRCATTFNKR